MAEIVTQLFTVEYVCSTMPDQIYYFYNTEEIIINCLTVFCETSSQVCTIKSDIK
jgi:hypothetical protein